MNHLMKGHSIHWMFNKAKVLIIIVLTFLITMNISSEHVGTSVKALDQASLTASIGNANIRLDGMKGTSSFSSLGRDKTIDVLAYEQVINSESTDTAGNIKITIKLDQNAAAFFELVMTQKTINSGEIYFFAPNSSGDGTTVKTMQINLKKINITSVRQALDRGDSFPVLEINLSCQSLEWISYDSTSFNKAVSRSKWTLEQ